MALCERLYELFMNLLLFLSFQNVRSILKTCFWKIYITIFGETVSAQSPPTGVQYRDGWIEVNGVASHVLTWGGWIEDPLPEGESLLVFMCGIPGVTLFYQTFLEQLHIQTGIPVWTICIAGHEIPPPSSNFKLTKDKTKYNNVKAQIVHRFEFFKKYVPNDRKIYLIGHSFGSKMVIELLKDEKIEKLVEKSVLLMPTIERFRDTPRTKFWLTIQKTGFVHLLNFCSWVLYVMPMSWQRQLALLYFRSRGLHSTHESLILAMIQFWHPIVFNNARKLAMDELEVVVHLDKELLMSQTKKMKVYFSPRDYWAPLTHCESLKTAVPDLPVEVLDNKFIHAFTLETAQDMADIVVKELKPQPDYKVITIQK